MPRRPEGNCSTSFAAASHKVDTALRAFRTPVSGQPQWRLRLRSGVSDTPRFTTFGVVTHRGFAIDDGYGAESRLRGRLNSMHPRSVFVVLVAHLWAPRSGESPQRDLIVTRINRTDEIRRRYNATPQFVPSKGFAE